MVSLILFFFAGLCKGVRDVWEHRYNQSIFHGQPLGSFFGANSWKRKYKKPLRTPDDILESRRWKWWQKPFIKLYVWYHDQFDLEYQEKFFGSGTFLVWTTDLYHMAAFCRIMFLTSAITFAAELQGNMLLAFVCYIAIHSLGFNLMHKSNLILKND